MKDHDSYDSDIDIDKENYEICKKRSKKYCVGKRSKFSQKLLEKYDYPARNILKKCLGDFIIDNNEITKQDLIVTDPDFPFQYIEVQVRTGWTKHKYPDIYVNIYARKAKYGDNTLFITFNRLLSECYIFCLRGLKLEPRRIKKYSREFVYDIPWYQVIWARTNQLTPKFLKKLYRFS